MENIEILAKYDSEDYYECEDYILDQEEYDYVMEIANDLLIKSDYIKVTGSMGLWNGSKEFENIFTEDFKTIVDNNINFDRAIITVYLNKIEVINCHHDGRNYYEFEAFDFFNMKLLELKEFIIENDTGTKEEIIEYYNYNRKKGYNSFSRATKIELLDYIDNNQDEIIENFNNKEW